MSNINISLILNEIMSFLRAYKYDLLEEHHDEIISNISYFSNYKNVSKVNSKHGCHFTNCSWSSNTCKEGPDTCGCFMIEHRLIRLKKLMLLYKRLK